MIDPKRRNEIYLIYTEEEGGNFKVFAGWNFEKFFDLKEKGYFEVKLKDRTITRIYPAWATLAKGLDNNDFIIDEINGTRKKPKERIVEHKI